VGLPGTPHCGHIPPPFFEVLVGGVSSGDLRQGHAISGLSGVTRNRLEQLAQTAGKTVGMCLDMCRS
jgi:hypothetical protein